MEKLDKFFTTTRRKRVYAIVGVLGAIAVAHGLVTADDAKAVVEAVGLALGVVAVPALAHRNAQ